MKKNHIIYKVMCLFFISCFLMMSILIAERFPISYKSSFQTAGEKSSTNTEGKNSLVNTDTDVDGNAESHSLLDSGSWSRPFDCLMIWNSSDENSQLAYKMMIDIFHDMKITPAIFDYADPQGTLSANLTGKNKCVVLLTDLSIMEEEEAVFMQWIQNGGNAMFGTTFWMDEFVEENLADFGISEAQEGYVSVETFSVGDGLVGSGSTFTIDDSFDCAWDVQTLDASTVYLWANNDRKTPLLWKCQAGNGEIVMVNLGIYEKNTRGIYAAAYSFLGEICIWPVINSVTWYLDDFPSPTPYNYSTYIQRDYGVDIASFYTDIWMPDVFSLTRKYGIRFTGGLIENYDNETDGNIVRNENISTFQYFGKLLLKNHGEIAIHGYNHQPLILDASVYGEDTTYQVWSSEEAIKKSLSEVKAFTEEQYKDENVSVYIPPSNILGQESRNIIGSDGQLKAIASTYLGDAENLHYEQEFEVADDGVVEIPRITSGEMLENNDWITAFSELNFHYVNTHFIHPDDVMDEDRGAENGWAKMFETLSGYASWVTSSANGIRYLTASELASEVRKFSSSQQILQNTENYYGIFNCEPGNSYLIRVNDGRLGQIKGGTVTEVSSGLYLLCAEAEEVSIEINE